MERDGEIEREREREMHGEIWRGIKRKKFTCEVGGSTQAATSLFKDDSIKDTVLAEVQGIGAASGLKCICSSIRLKSGCRWKSICLLIRWQSACFIIWWDSTCFSIRSFVHEVHSLSEDRDLSQFSLGSPGIPSDESVHLLLYPSLSG